MEAQNYQKKKKCKEKNMYKQVRTLTIESIDIPTFITTKYITTIAQRVEAQQMELNCFQILALFRRWQKH